MIILIIAFVALVLFFIIRPYFIKYDTIIAFSGGLGSGKTYLSVHYALRLLKKNRLKVFWHNNLKRYITKFFHYKQKLQPRIEKPLLYSSIPVRISRKEYATILTDKHLLLVDKVREKSVLLIDEIGAFADQFQYKHPNLRDNFNEFIRLYRHYTKGGYIVCNDQCSENIVLWVRRRLNTIHNLMRFRIWFKTIYSVKIRNIHISEEIKTVEDAHTEDSYSFNIGLPFFRKKYDTYCYSERYNTTLIGNDKEYTKFKKNDLLVLPDVKIEKQVNKY